MPTLPNQVDLLVDVESRRLVRSFTSTKSAKPLEFVFGDSVPLTARLLRQTSDSDPDNPFTELTLTNLQARVGIGSPSGKPSSGTFKITYDSNTTINLAYDASASNVQTQLNALTTITNDGGVTVAKPSSGFYRVVWTSVGARNAFTIDASPLYPTSQAGILEARVGSASVREVQVVNLETSNSAYVSMTDSLPSAAITVTTIRTGNVTTGTSEIQTVDLSTPEPIGGTWTATTNSAASQTNTSAPIAYNASAAVVQAALIATNTTLYTSNITVTGSFPVYTVEYAKERGDMGELTTDVTALTVPTGFRGFLNCNTAGFRELLGGATSASAILELEIYNTVSATSWTPLQVPCTVKEDLITI